MLNDVMYGQAVAGLVTLGRMCCLLFVVTFCQVAWPYDIYADWKKDALDLDFDKVQSFADHKGHVPYVVFSNTIEDFLNTTGFQTQKSCQVTGRVTGASSLFYQVGVHSNDYRVVLYSSKIDQDGSFDVTNVFPGTYRVAPLSQDGGKLIFGPPMGHLIACNDGQSIHVDFTIQGRRNQKKQAKVHESSTNSNTREQMGIQRNVIKQSTTSWPSHRRQQLILQMLRGQVSIEETARTYRLSVERLQQWREEFLMRAEQALERIE